MAIPTPVESKHSNWYFAQEKKKEFFLKYSFQFIPYKNKCHLKNLHGRRKHNFFRLMKVFFSSKTVAERNKTYYSLGHHTTYNSSFSHPSTVCSYWSNEKLIQNVLFKVTVVVEGDSSLAVNTMESRKRKNFCLAISELSKWARTNLRRASFYSEVLSLTR